MAVKWHGCCSYDKGINIQPTTETAFDYSHKKKTSWIIAGYSFCGVVIHVKTKSRISFCIMVIDSQMSGPSTKTHAAPTWLRSN